MSPTVMSRLFASAAAFVVGFGLANLALFTLTGADRVFWCVVAVVLMLTGAVGVLFADTRRPVSWWALLGAELLALFTVLPLLATLSLATAEGGGVARTLWPAFDGTAFGEVTGSSDLWRALWNSLLTAVPATVLAVALALPAAWAFVRRPPRRAHWAYLAILAVALAPTIVFAGPWSAQALDLGVLGSRWPLVFTSLALALPVAVWLSVALLRTVPWSLQDAVRADGATTRQMLRQFVVPQILPGALVVAALVLVVTIDDAVLGGALTVERGSRPLSATLLFASDELAHPVADVAAVGLLWLIPTLIVLLVAPRLVARLIGRTSR